MSFGKDFGNVVTFVSFCVYVFPRGWIWIGNGMLPAIVANRPTLNALVFIVHRRYPKTTNVKHTHALILVVEEVYIRCADKRPKDGTTIRQLKETMQALLEIDGI